MSNHPGKIDDTRVRELAGQGWTNVAIGNELGCSEATIRRLRQRLAIPASTQTRPIGDTEPPVVEFSLKGDTGSFTGYVSDKPLTDFADVFHLFDRDPNEFVIVDDSVSMRAWQQSKATEDGKRSTVTLYSYGARFRRKAGEQFTDADVAELSERVNSWSSGAAPVAVQGVPVAAILNLADMQLFKPAGGGVAATVERLQRALEAFKAHVEEVRARGWNLNEIVLVNNGDPFEGIAGNYSNQLHTVEGGLRAQMNAVLDVWLMFVRELFPMFEKRQFVSVLCNHTAFGRQGGAKDSITGDEDNGSAFLAETLQRVLQASPDYQDVTFTIPHDEMNVYTNAASIPIGFNHGHKIPASDASGFEKWINGQVRFDHRAYEARVWVTAHRHNLQMFDIGSASVLQCPSCDGGSKFLTDTTGKHSNAGVVSILVGEHHRLGWSDLTFL